MKSLPISALLLLASSAAFAADNPAPPPPPAPPPSLAAPVVVPKPSDESVKRLLISMGMDKSIPMMMQQVDRMIAQSVTQATRGITLTPEDKQLIEDSQKQTRAMAANQLGWDKLQADEVKAFAAAYSQDEIDAINAFFSTPQGKAFYEKQPQVMRQINMATQKRGQPVIMEIQASARQLSDTIAAKHKAAAPAPVKPVTTAPLAPAPDAPGTAGAHASKPLPAVN